MREERRLATVLFCDLADFTPLTERLETEQVRALQMSYFERMSAEIERFGGVIEKFAGDAILALFGVPTARGDDAERAVVCAVTLLDVMQALSHEVEERWDVRLDLRIGINTGDTVSGVVTAGGREDYSVTGDVVNTAARLQTAAEPGGIMVGAETMRLARKRVRFGEPREVILKGKAQPVAA
jgi:adenylate cyclase